MVNKVILIGRVGKQPEIKEVNQKKVASFSLATSEYYKDKNGERKEKTEWHSMSVWGPLAEVVEKYVSSGMRLYIEGKITNNNYEKDGVTHYGYKINVSVLNMLSSKKEDSSQIPSDYKPRGVMEQSIEEVEDLPF